MTYDYKNLRKDPAASYRAGMAANVIRDMLDLVENGDVEVQEILDTASVALPVGQIHATLALAEQQRIANDLLREVIQHVLDANQ